MPRNRRLHLPGAGFHITARTQEAAHWFVPEMRGEIVDDIEVSTSTFGHVLLAHAVMSNHIHIVLKQGSQPLGWLMQRIMQRIVRKVRRTRGGKGHVFGEPFWSGTCASPAYLRRAITYTHMNPVKAGLCEHPRDYAWTSHNKFMNATTLSETDLFPAAGMLLFAHQSLELSNVRRSYMRFIDRCIERRRNQLPGDWLLPQGPDRTLIPDTQAGDAHWSASYSAYTQAASHTILNVDVTTLGRVLIKRIAPDLTLDDVRHAGRRHALSGPKKELVAALSQAGCRTSAIARNLRVSQSYVSKIRAQMRDSVVQTKV